MERDEKGKKLIEVVITTPSPDNEKETQTLVVKPGDYRQPQYEQERLREEGATSF